MARFKITVEDSKNLLHTTSFESDCFLGAAQNEEQTGSQGFGYVNCPGHILMNTARATVEQVRSVLREVDPIGNDMLFKKIIVDMFEDEEDTDDES